MDAEFLPEVTEMLPHRKPFLFVDHITEAEPPTYLTAELRISPDSDFFQGHFPGNPVTPGVILLEAMTQAMVLLSILSSDRSDRFRYLFVGADRFRLSSVVAPGDLVTLHAQDLVHKGRLVRGFAFAAVGAATAASAEISFLRNQESDHG